MAERRERDFERAVEALVVALAVQADTCSGGVIAPAVLNELADSHHSIVRAILAVTSHLIHYGADPEASQLNAFRDQLTAALRAVTAPGPNGELPGDVAELVVDRPQDHLEAGDRVTLRYVNEDGTADVEASDDYVFVTVPLADLRRPR